MDKERTERIERYDKIFNNLKQTIINEQKNKEPTEVNNVIKTNLFDKIFFENMIKFYNDYQPEIVLKMLYIFELYKNIIKINNEKKELLLNDNIEKDTKDELYTNLLIDRKKYIDELTKFENFEQAKPYLESAINDINLDLYSNPNKEYNDEELYSLLKESEKIVQGNNLPSPPPSLSSSSSLSSLSRTQSSNQSETFTPPPPPSIEQKEVLIIKPLKNTVRDVNNKVIDFHQGPANDKMKNALFGENPNYTEFFQFDKSIDSEEFIDVAEGNKYDYIWIASPLFIDTTFKPIPICVDNLKNLLKKNGRIIFTLPTKNKNNNTIKIQDLYRDIPKPIDDVRKKDVDDLTTVFNQNFDYIKNDGYRMYKLKDIVQEPSNIISDESIINGIIGEILSNTSIPSNLPEPAPLAPEPTIPLTTAVYSDESIINGIIGQILSGTTTPKPPTSSRAPTISIMPPTTSMISDESIINGIIGQILPGKTMPKPPTSSTTAIPVGPTTSMISDESIINGIIGQILPGKTMPKPPTSSTTTIPVAPTTSMISDESIINGIIGQILPGQTLPGTTMPTIPSAPEPTTNSDQSIINGIIDKILTGTSRPTIPSAPEPTTNSDQSIINGIIGQLLSSSTSSSTSLLSRLSSRLSSILPSTQSLRQLSALLSSLVERILENVLRGIKITGKGVAGLTLLSCAIALGALYALGYIAPKELYKYINKLLNNIELPEQIVDVINTIKLVIKGDAESIEKLKKYTKIGTAGIVAGPPLLALGLAAGSLYGLGYITKKTLSTIVSNNKLRKSKGESDGNVDNDNDELNDEIVNETIELVELDKKRHIIDKILDEPITRGEERPDMSPLVARIEQMEENGDNITYNFIKNIFLNQEQEQNNSVEPKPDLDTMI